MLKEVHMTSSESAIWLINMVGRLMGRPTIDHITYQDLKEKTDRMATLLNKNGYRWWVDV